MTDVVDEEQVLARASDLAGRLAEHCAALRENPPHGAELDDVVSALVTRLLEQGFSQVEIRRAFHNALADLDRAAG